MFFADPMSCPEGLVWNEDLEVCDWFENASCEFSGESVETSGESILSESIEVE